MSDPATVKRQLKIQANVVKRLSKEHQMYRKEADEQQTRLDKFIAEGAEEWDIKNGRKVLDEGHKMIVDSQQRLGKAVLELRETVVYARQNPIFTDSEELKLAEEQLQGASI